MCREDNGVACVDPGRKPIHDPGTKLLEVLEKVRFDQVFVIFHREQVAAM